MKHCHPEITTDEVAVTLDQRYRLDVQDVVFLPLGGGSWCYRAINRDGRCYFAKVVRHIRPETLEAILYILDVYNFPVVPVIRCAGDGRAYAKLKDHALILHPFVEGDIVRNIRSAAEARYIGRQFGRLHSADLPLALSGALARDVFVPRGSTSFRRLLLSPMDKSEEDIGRKLSEFIYRKKDMLRRAYGAAVELGRQAKSRKPPLILCQGDANTWNIMRALDSNILFIDWDDLWFSSKEGDMIRFLEDHFLEYMEGYASIVPDARVDEVLVAYYKHERVVYNASDCVTRIITPAAVAPEQRKEELEALEQIFAPGGMLEDAEYYSQRTAKLGH